MAIRDKDASSHIEELMDWTDFRNVLRHAQPKDRLFVYTRLLDFLAGKKSPTPADAGHGVKDEAEKIIDELFNKKN